MGQERRQFNRCAVDFFVQEVREERAFLHPAVNLSVSGLYLLVSDDRRAIDANHELRLEFTLPTGVPIHTVARIAYMDERHGFRGIGVHFTDLAADDARAITRFIDAAQSVSQRRIA